MLTSDDIIENKKRYEEYARKYWESNPEYKRQQEAERMWREQQWAQGKIISPTIQNWLEGEITAARTILIIGMILTVLIKGQIAIWIIMYIAYRGRVKKARVDALEADKRRYKQ